MQSNNTDHILQILNNSTERTLLTPIKSIDHTLPTLTVTTANPLQCNTKNITIHEHLHLNHGRWKRIHHGLHHHYLSTVKWLLRLRLRHHHIDMSTKQVVHRRQDPLPETVVSTKQMVAIRRLHILRA